MPGAGSYVAASHIYNAAPKDGTVFGIIARDAALGPLSGAPGARFDATEKAEMVAPFLEGVDWADAHGSGALKREHGAAALLADALVAASEQSWSMTVAALERLINEYQDTLLVRFLSNG